MGSVDPLSLLGVAHPAPVVIGAVAGDAVGVGWVVGVLAQAHGVLAAENLDTPIIGRLVTRGLDDELKGTAYAVVDGVDGRTHHIRLRDLDAAGDSVTGSIVELRRFEDAKGERRVACFSNSQPATVVTKDRA